MIGGKQVLSEAANAACLGHGFHPPSTAVVRCRRSSRHRFGTAKYLSISQSAVTEAIKQLGGDLGVELFDRHSRGLTITHKGHQFLRHATKVLSDVSDARRTFSDDKENLTGTLNLGVTSLVAGYVLSDLLARCRRAFTGVTVSAIEDNGDYLEHLLIGGKPGEGNGFYYQPTLIAGALQSDEIVRREVFGLMVSVTRFTDADAAVS